MLSDPLSAVAHAQELIGNDPTTAVAAFFVISFFAALYSLVRSKDAHKADLQELQSAHATKIAELQQTCARNLADVNDAHAKELSRLNAEERERAVKLAVTMSSFLDMMDDVRFIAFEMRRVKEQRERKREQGPRESGDAT